MNELNNFASEARKFRIGIAGNIFRINKIGHDIMHCEGSYDEQIKKLGMTVAVIFAKPVWNILLFSFQCKVRTLQAIRISDREPSNELNG